MEETKLRAVGLSHFQNSERGATRRNKIKESNHKDDTPKDRSHDREKRTCNNCGVRGHIARNCPSPLSSTPKVLDKVDRKRHAPVADGKSPVRPRVSLEDRLGPPNAPPPRASRVKGKGGSSKGVNPRNPHMTEGAVCSHCGILNHNADQCWTLHPSLNPFMKRANAMMARVQREGQRAGKSLRAEQGA